jgi:hypothetical protein
MSTLLHTYADGSKLIRTSIRNLQALPIWKGNRIIDMTHVQRLIQTLDRDKTDVSHLDSGYKVITYDEEDAGQNTIRQSYVVDGQHRLAVIAEIGDGLDFDITYTLKEVADEAEAIEYFNAINTAKPIQYEEDPNLLVNRYISAISGIFPPKKKLIRTTKTKRPYLFIEDLRHALTGVVDHLRHTRPEILARKVAEWNTARCRELEIELSLMPTVKDAGIKQQAHALQFALAVEPHCTWIHTVIR